MQAERFIEFVRRKGTIPYAEAYRMIHTYFPDFRDFEGILAGAINSAQILVDTTPNGMFLRAAALPPRMPPTKVEIGPDTLI